MVITYCDFWQLQQFIAVLLSFTGSVVEVRMRHYRYVLYYIILFLLIGGLIPCKMQSRRVSSLKTFEVVPGLQNSQKFACRRSRSGIRLADEQREELAKQARAKAKPNSLASANPVNPVNPV